MPSVFIGNDVVTWLVVTGGVLAGLAGLWRQVIHPLWRFARWARGELREEIQRRKDTDALLDRELRGNGGSSMKDQATFAATQVARVNNQLIDVLATQKATSVVLDSIVLREAKEHSALWQALATHGIDRRASKDP